MGLLASRCGQMLNRTDLAGPLGVSVPTITQWLSILEATGQILLIPPYYENFGKRLVKSPKLYFIDSGFACSLLGIRDRKTLETSPFRGPLFEGMVAAEVVKHRLNRGLDRGLFWFRDCQGLEVDFILEERADSLVCIEVKTGKTVRPEDARNLLRLPASRTSATIRRYLLHDTDQPRSRPLLPDVCTIGIRSLHAELAGGEEKRRR